VSDPFVTVRFGSGGLEDRARGGPLPGGGRITPTPLFLRDSCACLPKYGQKAEMEPWLRGLGQGGNTHRALGLSQHRLRGTCYHKTGVWPAVISSIFKKTRKRLSKGFPVITLLGNGAYVYQKRGEVYRGNRVLADRSF
jgi:hypothetical protein